MFRVAPVGGTVRATRDRGAGLPPLCCCHPIPLDMGRAREAPGQSFPWEEGCECVMAQLGFHGALQAATPVRVIEVSRLERRCPALLMGESF